ncbi:hypothetical protein FRC00_010156 [Tulasnella sp. 408]|nr:hypothetical protein FRC00_010156 [Tulasnella sp. 408]
MSTSTNLPLDSASSTVDDLFGRTYYGVRKAKTPAPSDALDTIAMNLPDIGQDLLQVECQSAGNPSTSKPLETHLLIYNPQQNATEPPVDVESVLILLNEQIPAFHWRHGPRITKQIDRGRILEAVRVYVAQHAAPKSGASSNRNDVTTRLPPTGDQDTETDFDETGRLAKPAEAGTEAGFSNTATDSLEKNKETNTETGTVSVPDNGDTAPAPDHLAEGREILNAQRREAKRAIPVLSKNLDDLKAFHRRAQEFLDNAQETPIPMSSQGLTAHQVADATSDCRIRVKTSDDLFDEGTALLAVRAEAAEPLQEQLDRGNRWLAANNYLLCKSNLTCIAPRP